jgi:1,2-diacylglycerol 3-beta-galactosyltransferase
MKKILYLYSDTGGGHRASANALIKAVEKVSNDHVNQKMVDVFAECSGFLNIFAKLYSPVIRYAPKLWGFLWYTLDSESKLKKLEKMATPFVLKDLKKLILREKPDVIVSVHPMLNHITKRAMKETRTDVPFIIVVTDPVTFHRSWIFPDADAVIVATEAAAEKAREYGMPEEKIKVLGLPIDPRFSLKDSEKAALRVKVHHLTPKFTVLMMGGGEGSGNMRKIVKALDEAKLDIQLIVISGRNKKLERQLREEAKKFSFPAQVLGFTDQVPELMMESDLIITKAGPGSIAEALAMNLPMIITSWLPGQEEGNVDFVKRKNLGRICKNPKEIAKIVKELQENRSEFEKIKSNIAKERRPHAAFAIAKEILDFAKGLKT